MRTDEALLLPMVDILLGTAGILVLALLAVRPHLPAAATPDLGGALLLDGAGVTVAGETVPLAAVGGDPRLAGLVAPTLVIAADGLEAEFVLTARLARDGVASIRRIRLPPGCRLAAVGPQGATCG